jgi:protein-tyrosine phosphatase
MLDIPLRPHRVLFVCMGNICRSPAAEIVFRKLVTESRHESEFVIDSAGTIGHHHGSPPDPRMAATLQRRSYTVTGRARKISPADLERFDLVLTMDEENLAAVQKLDVTGAYHHKIRPFVEFCSRGSDLRVPDPYYGGQRGFDYVLQLLEDGCQGLLEHCLGAKGQSVGVAAVHPVG